MQREERVTVQGPIKEQQPDGMSHRRGGGFQTTPPQPCWAAPLSDRRKIFLGFSANKSFSGAFGAGPFGANIFFGADHNSGPVGGLGVRTHPPAPHPLSKALPCPMLQLSLDENDTEDEDVDFEDDNADEDDSEGHASGHQDLRELRALHQGVAQLLCQWPAAAFANAPSETVRQRAEQSFIALSRRAIDAYEKLLSDIQVRVRGGP